MLLYVGLKKLCSSGIHALKSEDFFALSYFALSILLTLYETTHREVKNDVDFSNCCTVSYSYVIRIIRFPMKIAHQKVHSKSNKPTYFYAEKLTHISTTYAIRNFYRNF